MGFLKSLVLFAGVIVFCSSNAAQLCGENELSIWSCELKGKVYSLCSSNNLNSTSGYMQYRASTGEEINFIFPETFKHPKGTFTFEVLASGARLTFNNNGYEYEISDQLIGPSFIEVSKSGKNVAEINCGHIEPGITATSTIALFKKIGIEK